MVGPIMPATGIMRTLQVGDNPTRLAQAIAEFGRIVKTLHTLNMIDDRGARRRRSYRQRHCN
jgi:TnpA family transposase